MKVSWTSRAEEDRDAIWAYIAANNPEAAARIDTLFATAARRLAEHPMMGRPGKVAGTRELVPHENYRLVYELHTGEVWILALVHTSRQWPSADFL